jgi:hypothetical protein
MNSKTLQKKLKSLYACTEATKWAKGKDLETFWQTCERADWLLWLAARVNVDRRKLVKCAALFAREVLKFVPQGEPRPLKAIEAAEKYVENPDSISRRELRDAAYAAYAATREEARKKYAAIVREHIPYALILEGLKE